MKKIKQLLSVILCICMIASMFIMPATASDPVPDILLSVDKTEAEVGDTVVVTISNNLMNLAGFGCLLYFDNDILECTEITGADGDEYLGLNKTSGKTTWVDCTYGDTVEDTNSDGIFSFGLVLANNTEFAAGIVATLTFTAKSTGSVDFKLEENSSIVDGDGYIGEVDTQTIVITAKPVHATDIEFEESAITINIGEKKTLTPTIEPADYTDTVTWSSEDETIATVDSNGLVTGVSKGVTTITATVSGIQAFCEVEVVEAACTHANKTNYEAKTATCVEGGWDAYSECTKCGQLFDSDGKEIDKIPTTQSDPNNHSYGDPIQAKEAVHTQDKLEPAVAAHYQCSLCQKYFTEDKAATTLDALIGETPSHSYSDDWKSDENSHWHVCECGKKSDEAAHNFEWKTDKNATEDETGLKHEECTECGIKRNENTTIDKLDHVHIGITHHPAVPATCTDTGTKEYWTCSSDKCAGKYYGDAECMIVIDSIITPIDPNNHKLGDLIQEVPATHTKDELKAGMKAYYVCEDCDKLFNENKEEVEEADLVIPAPVHNYDKYGKDSDNHWFECTCGAIKDGSIAAHNYNNKKYNETAHWDECICGAKDSSSYAEHTLVTTYTEDTHTFACSGCDYSKTAKHSPEIINFVDATYDSEGYSGDVVCKDCEYLIAEGTVIPKRSYIIIFPPVTDTGNSGTGENESGSETDPVKPEDWTNPFTDITETDECYEAVRFVNENGLIIGMSTTEFAPEVVMNRAMFVTILGRAEGIPEDGAADGRFEDVDTDTWYSPYIGWADESGIITGYSDTVYGPLDNITVEQACVILARYAEYLGYDISAEPLGEDSGFEDVADISDWAVKGMAWAVQSGIYTADSRLNPGAPATRAMVAMMLYRLSGVVTEFLG